MTRILTTFFRALLFPAAFFLIASVTAQTASAQTAMEEKVVGGPYVVNAAAKSATVMWIVQSGQSSLGTWLYRIGVNVCLNRVSAKAPATESIDERQHVDSRSESPSERLLKEERAARVRAAIAELPRKQRATLILRMYHEMSHQEIADVLGSSVGAVKANFFHALGNLKKLLGDEVE